MEVFTTDTQSPLPIHSPAPIRSSSPWLWVVVTLVILLIVFAFIVAGLEIADLRTDLARANNTLQQVSTHQQQQWQEWNQAHPQINSQLQQLSSEQSEQHDQLSQLQQQLETWRLRWEQELSKDPLKRQMNDLQDVLDQAYRHLLLTASAPQSQALLEQAYAMCTRFESTLLQPVCLLIAQDKQALSGYDAPNTGKILEQLSQLESHLLLPLQQAQQLKFTPTFSNPVSNSASETQSSDLLHYFLNKWLYVWQQLGNFIRDYLVQVHHLHKAPNDHYQLKLPELDQLAARLSLLFQQARTALLIQNQPVFQSTLAEIQLITKTQQTLIPNQAALIAELAPLQNLSILQTPPLNLKAREMLTRLLKSYGNINTPPSAATASAATLPAASP